MGTGGSGTGAEQFWDGDGNLTFEAYLKRLSLPGGGEPSPLFKKVVIRKLSCNKRNGQKPQKTTPRARKRGTEIDQNENRSWGGEGCQKKSIFEQEKKAKRRGKSHAIGFGE